jgi:hypothetical protein
MNFIVIGSNQNVATIREKMLDPEVSNPLKLQQVEDKASISCEGSNYGCEMICTSRKPLFWLD